LGRDREGVADFVRGITDDAKTEALFQLLDNWRIVWNKFDAIAHFAKAASARVISVGIALGEKQEAHP
jgi:hypothetical protein